MRIAEGGKFCGLLHAHAQNFIIVIIKRVGVISAAYQQVDHKDEKVSNFIAYCVYYSIAQTFMNIIIILQ